METPLGSFEIELFDEEAPATVANFLNYVADGDYTDSFIHRSVPQFVIQGGGYTFQDSAGDTFQARLGTVPADDPVANEFGRSNTRGTIAMAKLGGDPDSATSQWFINLADNSANLDDQNGGFTVFGEVTGDGMTVVDAISAVKIWNAGPGSPFDQIPLIDFPGGSVNDINSGHLVMVTVSIDDDPDNDGITDDMDNCPAIANPDQQDTDADNQGDSCDADDDNDGLSDVEEAVLGTDPLRADTDGDGVDDGAEITMGRNPRVNEAVLLLLLGSTAEDQ
jgi:cyclophilin family peptidyl-prolyl cis-trans isomerase